MWTIDPALPADLATALIARLDDGPDAGATRDLPARRRLDHLLHWFGSHRQDIQAHPEAAQALADTLAAHDLPAAAARLHMLLAAPGPSAEHHLTHAADLLAERPVTADHLAGRLPSGDWATPDTARLITSLLQRGAGAAGRFALALTVAAGQATNWNQPWDDHLRALRRHHNPDLRDAALAVRTAPE